MTTPTNEALRRNICRTLWLGAETEACVFAYAADEGFERAVVDAEIDLMLDAGILEATISITRPGEPHYPMLRLAPAHRTRDNYRV